MNRHVSAHNAIALLFGVLAQLGALAAVAAGGLLRRGREDSATPDRRYEQQGADEMDDAFAHCGAFLISSMRC